MFLFPLHLKHCRLGIKTWVECVSLLDYANQRQRGGLGYEMMSVCYMTWTIIWILLKKTILRGFGFGNS